MLNITYSLVADNEEIAREKALSCYAFNLYIYLALVNGCNFAPFFLLPSSLFLAVVH